MAFSFVRIISPDTYDEIYTRGLAYYQRGVVRLTNVSSAACTAEVRGTTTYEVRLGFKVVTILINLVDKNSLGAKEKEAVKAAIGVLSWAALSDSNTKRLKAKRDRSAKW